MGTNKKRSIEFFICYNGFSLQSLLKQSTKQKIKFTLLASIYGNAIKHHLIEIITEVNLQNKSENFIFHFFMGWWIILVSKNFYISLICGKSLIP